LSSQELWVDGYEASHPMRKVSIYHKGALLSLILDVQIRIHSAQKYSLDTLMQWLNTDTKILKEGYTAQDIKEKVRELGYTGVDAFFEQHIYGVVPLENILFKALSYLGIVVERVSSNAVSANKFGLKYEIRNNQIIVTYIANNSPFDKKMLIGAKILQINDQEIDLNNVESYFENKESLKIKFSYKGFEYTKNIVASGVGYCSSYKLKMAEELSEHQKQNFMNWAHIVF
jgi:predicted metalloprotease with PDZ domain